MTGAESGYSIARTMVITPAGESQWRIDAQVGAGIVPDSEPARQYHETLNKAQSILSALTIANAWVTGCVLLRSRRPD